MDESKKISLIHKIKITIGIMIKYSFFWSLCYIFLMLLSAVMIPLQIVYMGKVITSLTTRTDIIQSLVLFTLSYLIVDFFNNSSNYFKIQMKSALYRKHTPIIFNKFQTIRYEEFEKKDNQDLIHWMSNNPEGEVIGSFILIINTVYAVVSVIGILITLYSFNWTICLAGALILVPIVIIESLASKKEMNLRWTMTTSIRKRFYVQKLFVDKDALQEIKIFNSKDKLHNISSKLADEIHTDHNKAIKYTFRLTLRSRTLLILFMTFSLVRILYVDLNVSSLAIVISFIAAIRLYQNQVYGFADTVIALLRVSNHIQYLIDFMNLPDNYWKKTKDFNLSEPKDITFSNVWFRYNEDSEYVLKGVSFQISSNENISFVGENGAGKSTIIKLICGLYKPNKGRVYINGVDTYDMSYNDRKKAISVVFQDFFKYHLTIRENISLGNIDSIDKDELLLSAINRADGLDIVQQSKNGLDQYVGIIDHESVDLSLGQWQKLSLSRAMLNKSSFLILDEPTASLDPVAESQMYNRFLNVLDSKGIILISHRVASAKLSDRIIVIKNGVVVETGNHSVLMSNDGEYSSLFKKQRSWYVNDESKGDDFL